MELAPYHNKNFFTFGLMIKLSIINSIISLFIGIIMNRIFLIDTPKAMMISYIIIFLAELIYFYRSFISNYDIEVIQFGIEDLAKIKSKRAHDGSEGIIYTITIYHPAYFKIGKTSKSEFNIFVSKTHFESLNVDDLVPIKYSSKKPKNFILWYKKASNISDENLLWHIFN